MPTDAEKMRAAQAAYRDAQTSSGLARLKAARRSLQIVQRESRADDDSKEDFVLRAMELETQLVELAAAEVAQHPAQAGDLLDASCAAVFDWPGTRVLVRRSAKAFGNASQALERQGHFERSFRAHLCRLQALQVTEFYAPDQLRSISLASGPVSVEPHVVRELQHVVALLKRWLAADEPLFLRAHQALGIQSGLVRLHEHWRSDLEAEIECVNRGAQERRLGPCIQEPVSHPHLDRVFKALGGRYGIGAGSTLGGVTTSARRDLGPVVSEATAQRVRALLPSYERIWVTTAPAAVTERWLRGLSKLRQGDLSGAAQLTPSADIDDHAATSWFSQLLLLRSRFWRDRGLVQQALEDSSKARGHEPWIRGLRALEHAENLRALGRLPEADMVLERARRAHSRHIRFVGRPRIRPPASNSDAPTS